jgi:uncharacterized OB-fold protein
MGKKAIPVPTPVSEPYWAALARHELTVQLCGSCGQHNFYPRLSCPACGSRQLGWMSCTGRARLHSFVINHFAAPGFEDEVPYVIAIVELEEGPRMMTNLRGVPADPAYLVVDMPLEVVFESRDGLTLPMFQPAGSAA